MSFLCSFNVQHLCYTINKVSKIDWCCKSLLPTDNGMLQSIHLVLQCLEEIIFLLIFLTLMDFLWLNRNSHQFAPTVSLAYTICHGWTTSLFVITWTGLTANIGEFLIVSNFASRTKLFQNETGKCQFTFIAWQRLVMFLLQYLITCWGHPCRLHFKQAIRECKLYALTWRPPSWCTESVSHQAWLCNMVIFHQRTNLKSELSKTSIELLWAPFRLILKPLNQKKPWCCIIFSSQLTYQFYLMHPFMPGPHIQVLFG